MTASSDIPLATPAPAHSVERVEYRGSYWKTTTAVGIVAAVAALPVFVLAPMFWAEISALPILVRLVLFVALLGFLALFVATATIFAGGVIALRRDLLEAAGRPYIARRPRESRPTFVGNALRLPFRFRRSSRSLRLRPGESVEVRSLDEILATLDADGKFDGLLFTPEMAAYCGQRTTVFRRVDKLNDWIHGVGLKRVYDTVQLDVARCNGAAHGGCQSDCRLRWKEAWLKRAGSRMPLVEVPHAQPRLVEADLYRIARRDEPDGTTRYTCQATELANAGEPIAWGDPRHYIRDWATGNARLQPLLLSVAIMSFNWTQRKRRGVMFPCMAPSTSKSSPSASLGLKVGDRVRVRPKNEIEETLNNRNRNRGLPFDLEMLRFCGAEFRVSGVHDHVVTEGTGLMRQLTVPCIVLEGVRASGEYRAFNPEDEHIFWREIWLERVNTEAPQ